MATYHFRLKVDEGSSVETGDFVTIYNFYGLVDGSVKAPEGWEFSSGQFGKTPDLNGYPLVLPVDVPGTPNITLTARRAARGGMELTFTAQSRITAARTVTGMYSAVVTRPADTAAPRATGTDPDPMLSKEARIGRLTLPDFRADVETGLRK